MSATKVFSQVRLQMKKIGWFARLSNQQPSAAMNKRIAGGIGVTVLMMTVSIAGAQNPTPAAPLPMPEAKMTTPNGYTIHQSVDLGGRITNATGSNAMYDTLVNCNPARACLAKPLRCVRCLGRKARLSIRSALSAAGSAAIPTTLRK
jgi:hypothetical protein